MIVHGLKLRRYFCLAGYRDLRVDLGAGMYLTGQTAVLGGDRLSHGVYSSAGVLFDQLCRSTSLPTNASGLEFPSNRLISSHQLLSVVIRYYLPTGLLSID